MATIRDICTDALFEIGVVAEGEAMSADVGDFTRRKLERMFNLWNAQGRAIYAWVFSSFTLTPSLAPHTIGPTGATFTYSQRPVDIKAIALELNTSSPSVFLNLNKRDAQWWQEEESVPDLATSIPTDFYYGATWPNGSIHFWPVPTVAYPVQLQLALVIDDTLGLNDTFTMPQGYQEAVTLSLAEVCCRPFGKMAPPDLARDARTARATVFGNNDQVPRLTTCDAGMQAPSVSGVRPTFNYLIGQ